MTKILKFYKSRDSYHRDTMIGFNPLHQDFINGTLRVTWVDGPDDPNNSDEAKKSIIRDTLHLELRKKLQADIISTPQLKMLLRFELGIDLQQTTLQKLQSIFVGGMQDLAQRIRNLFNL